VRKETCLKRSFAPALLALLVIGCATPPKPVWVAAEETYKGEKSPYSVDLPPGWMRLNVEDRIVVTRDGTPLQMISVRRAKVGEPLAYSKKKFEKGMLPQEMAGILIDAMSTMEGVAFSEIQENTPAKFGGVDGFRLVLRFRLKNGLEKKWACYGAMSGDWVYTVAYTAVARHYYERDLDTFEKTARSFRIL
jgi:hypothetical protein